MPRTFVSCLKPSLGTTDSIRPRITDASFWGSLWLHGSRVIEMQTGQDPMISERDAMAQVLLELAA